jgi:peptidoglycan-associated lipoprotein
MLSRRLVAGIAAVLLMGGCTTLPASRAAIETAPPACQPLTVSLYFEQNSAQITEEARTVLSAAAAQTRGCTVERVRVTGLADAPGAPGANLELSKARAASVTSALTAVGLHERAEFEVVALGAMGATDAQGAAAPLRRRVDVAISQAAPR